MEVKRDKCLYRSLSYRGSGTLVSHESGNESEDWIQTVDAG